MVLAAPVLPGPLGALAPVLNQYGYLAVGALVLVEDFGVPSPGETVLVAAAVYAGAGQLNVCAVAAIGFVAAVMGDNIGFAIGHYGGRRLAVRLPICIPDSPATRTGGEVLHSARWHGCHRGPVHRGAAPSQRHHRRHQRHAVAAICSVQRPRRRPVGRVWTSVGYLAGNHLTTIYGAAHRYEIYLAAAVGLVVLGLIVRHSLRRRATSRRTQ
ncbi:MAG TPA: DedA family protein [Pseudonocardiaceae bacterium]|nr:DedA family protein [Pseudonocardiaceae bacterium]